MNIDSFVMTAEQVKALPVSGFRSINGKNYYLAQEPIDLYRWTLTGDEFYFWKPTPDEVREYISLFPKDAA